MNTEQSPSPLQTEPTTLSEEGETVTPQKERQTALILILLITALFCILIGLFLWFKASQTPPVALPTPTRPTAEINNEPESTTAEAQTESFGAMSTSDEIEAIEADLESTNLDSLESELLQIETELNAQM
jgi:cytoskeletal protein RodZ